MKCKLKAGAWCADGFGHAIWEHAGLLHVYRKLANIAALQAGIGEQIIMLLKHSLLILVAMMPLQQTFSYPKQSIHPVGVKTAAALTSFT